MTRFRHNLPEDPPIKYKPVQWIGVPPPEGKLTRILKWAEGNPVTTLAWLSAIGSALLIGFGMLLGAMIW